MSDSIYTVRPVKNPGGSRLPVKGKELIPDLNARVFLTAKSGSGKSTVLRHIIKHTADPRTTFVIFASTVNIDPVYTDIVKFLKRKKVPVFVFDNIEDGKENLVESFLKMIEEEAGVGLSEPAKEIEVLQPRVITPLIKTDQPSQSEPESSRGVRPDRHGPRESSRVPKFCLILDDLSHSQLRAPWMYDFLKKARHYCRVLISSQNLTDLTPSSFQQLTQVLVWGGFSQTYIHKLWERMNIGIDFKTFWSMYLDITKKKYGFLNIHLQDWTFRRNFDPKPINYE